MVLPYDEGMVTFSHVNFTSCLPGDPHTLDDEYRYENLKLTEDDIVTPLLKSLTMYKINNVEKLINKSALSKRRTDKMKQRNDKGSN
jgi:hypothetical protein